MLARYRQLLSKSENLFLNAPFENVSFYGSLIGLGSGVTYASATSDRFTPQSFRILTGGALGFGFGLVSPVVIYGLPLAALTVGPAIGTGLLVGQAIKYIKE